MENPVGRTRLISIAALIAAGSLTLAACGSSGGGGTKVAAGCPSGGGKLNADGSSAQYNAMAKWSTDYQDKCSGVTINYTSTNSGQGVSDFIAGKIGFGGSDAALNPTAGEPAKATATCGSTALDIPMVTGPIAIAYNVAGVTSLTLTPTVLTRIFLGKITSWNDPQIADLNAGVKLPATKISVFFRSDPSGTSKNFETYLAANDPTDFTYTPDKPWPGKTGSGENGSAAVASSVKATSGGIGYMEWSYAGNSGLSVAKINNGAGAVQLTAQTVGTFVAGAKIVGTGNDLTLKIDYTAKTPNGYPIDLVTYEIVCSKYKDASTGALVKDFLTYTSSNAVQAGLPSLGYAPLPASILTRVQSVVASLN
jgi:phosphate transport system substrate-binding protein